MLKSLVVDASFSFRLILPGPQQAYTKSLVEQWVSEEFEIFAPTLWLYEITSALCKVVHFGAITLEEGHRALRSAQSIGMKLIPPDEALSRLAFDWTIRLKRAAAYDSFYLALAEKFKCKLWTADKRLYNATNVPWVCWFGAQQ